MRTIGKLALVLLSATVFGCGAPEPDLSKTMDAPPSMTRLHSWHSPSRGDGFTTADPAWAGTTGARRSPDYTYHNDTGWIFPSGTQPPDTSSLASWWHPGRADNFLTADPAWQGAVGATRDGYTLFRQEGFVHSKRVANSLPLMSFWNPGVADNFATTHPMYMSELRTVRDGYTAYRREGWVVAPDGYGADALREFGFGSNLATGRTPVLVLLVQFSDLPFHAPHTSAFYRNLIFGPDFPNVVGYYAEQSGGLFSFSEARTMTITMADDPSTSINDGLYNCAANRWFDTDGDGDADPLCPGATDNLRNRVFAQVENDPSFSFATYDRNHDGRITRDELVIAFIGAEPAATSPTFPITLNVGAATDVDINLRPTPTAPNLNTGTVFMGEGGAFSTLVHELGHARMRAYDLYGADSRLHVGASIMSGTIVPWEDDRSIWGLDPWHKLTFGWLKPRLVPISSESAGGVEVLRRVGDTGQPLLFYDLKRGTREYFLVEYRNGAINTRNYDKDGVRGLAVWYVRLRPDAFVPYMIPAKIYPGPNGTLDTVRDGRDSRCGTDICLGGNDVLDTTATGDDTTGYDFSVYLQGGPSWTRGGWTYTASNITLRYPGDTDRDARILLRQTAYNAASPTQNVEWIVAGHSLLPRLDRINEGVALRAGQTVSLEGRFGLAFDTRTIKLVHEGSGRVETATTVAWTPSRVLATLPTGIAAGRYLVMGDGGSGSYGNGIRVTVSE